MLSRVHVQFSDRNAGVFGAAIVLFTHVACCTHNDPPTEEAIAPLLLCDVPVAEPMVPQYSESAEFACRIGELEAPRPLPVPPVFVGRAARGETLILDRIDATADFRVFVRTADETTQHTAVVAEALADGSSETFTYALRTSAGALVGGTVASPLVPNENGDTLLRLDYAAAEVTAVYDEFPPALGPVELHASASRLAPVEQCGTELAALPAPKEWLGLLLAADTPDDQAVYVFRFADFVVPRDAPDTFLFYGAAELPVQRDVVNHRIQKDGATEIEFAIGSGTASLIFDGGCEQSPIPTECPGTLVLDDGTALDVIPRPRSSAERAAQMSQFICRFEWLPSTLTPE